jgi:hypothetical protein
MKGLLRSFVLGTIAALALIGVVATISIIVARAWLPKTACTITEAQVDGLAVEKMSYQDVKTVLGCDGVRTNSDDLGGSIVIEDFSWRGDAWPYGKFDGHFINGKLHGTSKIWLNWAVTVSKP